ncbi:thylakoid-associated protein [Pleurocapsales cyanobacterium LEGE 06147]|nr:thylakoid-associated protein [Pleurocapsales cyanobacterium LEGE 06147]
MNTNFIDEYQNQVREWQDQFFDIWLATFPGKKGESVDISETFEKSLDLQHEFSSATIRSQQAIFQLFIEAQQKFVKNYFSLLKRAPIPKGKFEYQVPDGETGFRAEAQVG